METLVDPADAAVNSRLTKEEKIHFLREMFRIRRFEQTSLKYYNLGKMGGFLHLYSGQEAVAVGTISLLGENDHVITAYRDHGHALAVGMDMKACMAELFGKATGCSKGKGGSMHFFAPDKNYWGGHGIVGGQTPLRPRTRFRAQIQGPQRGCCLCLSRGRSGQPGHLPRVAQPGGVIQALRSFTSSKTTDTPWEPASSVPPPSKDSSPKGPKAITSAGMSPTVKTSTRFAPRRRSPSIAPTTSRSQRCSKFRRTVTTDTPSPTPSQDIGSREEIEKYKAEARSDSHMETAS